MRIGRRDLRLALVALAFVAMLGTVIAVRSRAEPASGGRVGQAAAPSTTTSTTIDPATVRALLTPTGVVVPVTGGSPGAWQITTPCGEPGQIGAGEPLVTARVVIDAGHGGEETGAVGATGLTEAELNLAVAERVARRLNAAGIGAVLTRTGEYRLTVATRVAIARQLGAEVLVSVHHNGGPAAPSALPGTQAIYQSGSEGSRRLAGLMYQSISSALTTRSSAWHGGEQAGAFSVLNPEDNDFYGILRQVAPTTAVIAEAAFLSSSVAEAELLADPGVQQAEADALAAAIRRFLGSDAIGSGFVKTRMLSDGGSSGGRAGCDDPPLE